MQPSYFKIALILLLAGSSKSKTEVPWVGPSVAHPNGKKLSAGGSTDYAVSGEGVNRTADLFTTMTITFDEKAGGTVEEWDSTVVYACREMGPGHDCIYFNFQKLYNRDQIGMGVVKENSTKTLPSLESDQDPVTFFENGSSSYILDSKESFHDMVS